MLRQCLDHLPHLWGVEMPNFPLAPAGVQTSKAVQSQWRGRRAGRTIVGLHAATVATVDEEVGVDGRQMLALE